MEFEKAGRAARVCSHECKNFEGESDETLVDEHASEQASMSGS